MLLNFVRCAHDASIDFQGILWEALWFWHELPPGVIRFLKKGGDFGCFRSIGIKDTRYDRLLVLISADTSLGVLSLVRTIFAAILLSIAKLLTLRLSAFWSLSSCICTSKNQCSLFSIPQWLRTYWGILALLALWLDYIVPQLGRNLMLRIIISGRNCLFSIPQWLRTYWGILALLALWLDYIVPQLGRNLWLRIIISGRNCFNSYKTFGVAPSLGILRPKQGHFHDTTHSQNANRDAPLPLAAS